MILIRYAALVTVLLMSCLSPSASSADEAISPIPPIIDETALKDGQGGRPSVDPCVNFYQFACGNWLDTTVIPSDKKGVYRAGTALGDQIDIQLSRILADPANGQKLNDYYWSCMNKDAQISDSRALFDSRMSEIKGMNDSQTLARVIARLHKSGTDVLFSLGSSQDYNDSSRVIPFLLQAGMSLPNRDYYLADQYASIVTEFRSHMSSMLQLLGSDADSSKKQADRIFQFEHQLAEAAYSLDDSFDPTKTNHPMTLGELKALMPHFDWDTYLKEVGAQNLQSFNVMEPEFLQRVDELLAKSNWSDVQAYLSWQYIRASASNLDSNLEAENFRFFHSVLQGQKTPLARWKSCTQKIETNPLNYALAEAYTRSFDGEQIKKKTNEYIDLIKNTFAVDLQQLSWLDQATASAALEKLSLLSRKVGAPEKFRDYDALEMGRKSALANDEALNRFEFARQLAKIGQPVDLTEWSMMPWEVNAYYDPSNNQFNFPYGILQPPSFDLQANDGVNLGAFGGGTIGHELTHGFDKDGHHYDGHGNLVDWWTPSVSQEFDQRTQCYIDQANQYKVEQANMFVKGKQTITENIADQGGVKLGYMALDAILKNRAEAPAWGAGKYSERQQYWIAYGQSWCTKSTTESLVNQMTSNEHPPAEFRVNGVVMNRPEFARDFGCQAGQPMAPKNRCALW
jgi:endothelin-converting enzyme/putative endopeptidase